MLLDSNGVPYSLGGLDYSGGGVKLNDYVVPKSFDMPESIYARQEEVKTGGVHFYGNEMTHHAAQLLALKYLRDNAGFDDLVWCQVLFGKNVFVMVLQLSTGLWCELNGG